METQKKLKYRWENKLSYEDRQKVISYYLEGYGLYHIGITFGVTASTIEYHLKNANVFIPYKKPTLFGNQNPIKKKPRISIKRNLTFSLPKDNDKNWYDEYGNKYSYTKAYKYYRDAQRALERKRAKEMRQYRMQREIEDMQYLNGPFSIRISLRNNTCLERMSDGTLRLINLTSTPSLFVSESLYSI